jgi:hypothetical protein
MSLQSQFARCCESLTSGIDIQAANQWLIQLSQSEECLNLCFEILSSNSKLNENFYSSIILYQYVKNYWNAFPIETRNNTIKV